MLLFYYFGTIKFDFVAVIFIVRCKKTVIIYNFGNT